MANANVSAVHENLIKYLGDKPTIYGSVLSVAKSDMSYKIAFYCIYEGRIERLSWEISKVLGLPFDRDLGAVIKKGCGMDMIFAVIYDLGEALYNNGYAIKKEAL